MAYTWVAVASAFHKDATHEGYDYLTAQELLKRIADAGQGRVYTDSTGNLVYESRLHRGP
jgi:hypothetical protein